MLFVWEEGRDDDLSDRRNKRVLLVALNVFKIPCFIIFDNVIDE